MVRGLESMTYEEKWKVLDLLSLEQKGLRRGMISVFSYVKDQFSFSSFKFKDNHDITGWLGFCKPMND